MKMRSVLRWVTCLSLAGALFAGTALASDGFEFHGYGRAISSMTSDLTKVTGPTNKNTLGRLGNEDNYFELALSKSWEKENGVKGKWTTILAPGDANGGAARTRTFDNDGGNTDVGIRNFYAELSGLEGYEELTFWGGKRFYGRDDIYITDFYWRDFSGTGAGVQGLMDGKLDLAYIASSAEYLPTTKDGDTLMEHTIDARYKVQDNLELQVAFQLCPDKDEAGTEEEDNVQGDSTSGIQVAAVKGLKGFFGTEGGWSKVAVQMGMGLGSTGGLGHTQWNYGTMQDDMSIRALTFGQKDMSDTLSVMAQAVIQMDMIDAADDDTMTLSLAARPVFKMSENMTLQTEVGMDMVETGNDSDSGMTYKVTVAPTVALDAGFWTKPQISAFVTLIGGDEERGIDDGDTELTMGFHTEVWF